MATTELTKTESRRLSELEEVISRGIETFVEVGHALKEIRDSKLYRQEYSAFENYCRAKWGWSRAYSYGLIEAGDIAQSLSPIGDISTESQARELSRIKDPKERTEVWTQVTKWIVKKRLSLPLSNLNINE